MGSIVSDKILPPRQAWPGVSRRITYTIDRTVPTHDLTDLERRRLLLHQAVTAAAMPETDRLAATLRASWPAIEVLIVTGVTNARTEAANTGIKLIKRTGRGYRNPAHYRARILLANAARTAA